MTKINAFDVLKEMGRRNMRTLKGFGLSNVRRAQTIQKDTVGLLEIAVDPETAVTVMLQKPIRFMLIVADDADYLAVEADLQKAHEAERE